MKHFIGASNPMREQFNPQASYVAEHFAWSFADGVGTVTLNRPDRKNPLTFQSYAELRDFFYALRFATDVKAIVVTGAGGNFCSGGDVHEIIGPLTTMTMPELLEWSQDVVAQAEQTDTRLTEIMLAQDFHDLTGQVIARVVQLAGTIEEQLLSLLLQSAPTGTPGQDKAYDMHALEGPVVSTEGRTDVVADQKDVDDLLASLGF